MCDGTLKGKKKERKACIQNPIIYTVKYWMALLKGILRLMNTYIHLFSDLGLFKTSLYIDRRRLIKYLNLTDILSFQSRYNKRNLIIFLNTRFKP
jgi:hypothetical protein